MLAHLALPWQVVCLEAAPVEGDEEVGAAVTVGQRDLCVAHLLAGDPWKVVSGTVVGQVSQTLGSYAGGGLLPMSWWAAVWAGATTIASRWLSSNGGFGGHGSSRWSGWSWGVPRHVQIAPGLGSPTPTTNICRNDANSRKCTQAGDGLHLPDCIPARSPLGVAEVAMLFPVILSALLPISAAWESFVLPVLCLLTLRWKTRAWVILTPVICCTFF